MTQRFDKLVALLKELFQLDQPDLDFGFYRIMHAKSAEVTQFLERDLLPQVKAAFAQYQPADKAGIEKELAQAIEQARALGADPEGLPKVKELRARLAQDAVDLDALEAEVYDHLFSFFRRYYSEGDFLSKRVYKPGVYAIPYEGEEVKLHWANADQYYIKTSEYLRDYAFRLRPDDAKNPMRVHFRLVDASEGEHGNVKEAAGKERRFKLAGETPVAVEGGELVIRFTFEPDPKKQRDLNGAAEERILGMADVTIVDWIRALGRKHVRADGTESEATRLRVHLDRYTARNTFDYFIHKDLGGFLRRELDFYIKNEVMHLDDVDSETAPRVEQYLSKIKVIRSIAGKIITFLAQLEDFQKKLWLKKKFVVETSWCIRVGCIPEELYPEIAANEAQREEWVKHCHIDQVKGDQATPGYSKPLKREFLNAHPELVVDTRHFGEDFSRCLPASFNDIEKQLAGLVLHGENFHALRLLLGRYRSQVRCIYLDPPYNTGSDEFVYKDRYQSSSWVQCLMDRLLLAQSLLAQDGVLVIQISDHEDHRLKLLLDTVFGADNFVNRISVKTRSPSGFKTVNLGVFEAAEYLYIYAKDKKALVPRTVYVPCDHDANYHYVVTNKEQNPSSWTIRKVDEVVAEALGFAAVRDAAEHLGRQQFDAKVAEHAIANAERVFRYTAISDTGASRETVELKYKSKEEPNRIFVQTRQGYEDRYLQGGQELTFYSKKVKEIDGQMTPTMPVTNIWTDIAWEGIAAEGGVTLKQGKKPERLVQRLLEMFTNPGDLVLDFFAGSGTTAAVSHKMQRRWIAVEMAEEIVELMRTRIMNALSGHKSGIRVLDDEGNRGAVQLLRLEGYEDALNSLELRRTPEQQVLLDLTPAHGPDKLREQYLLRYMLDVETHGSQSLLNIAAFTDPTAYQLNVKRPGSDESREVNVDLLETFNWLIGLTVQRIAAPQTFNADFAQDAEKRLRLQGQLDEAADGPWCFRTVTGTMPDGRKALVIWRKRPGGETVEGIEQDNLVLDEWFTTQGQSKGDGEFDLIYVNGTNNLENLKAPDATWSVRLIEEDFHRLMFDADGA